MESALRVRRGCFASREVETSILRVSWVGTTFVRKDIRLDGSAKGESLRLDDGMVAVCGGMDISKGAGWTAAAVGAPVGIGRSVAAAVVAAEIAQDRGI